jgi:NitT/TauT family transport system substrate-binding protein
MMHKLPRRSFIALSGAAAVSAGWKTRALAKSAKVTAGYIHALAVDGQLWLADAMDVWKAEGLDMQFVEFQNGNEAFQALIAGTLDVLTTGAVISRYPATGAGKVFLINDIEFATAQLWCHPEMGIKKIGDLKGRKITTTTGTTAHYFLVAALRANGMAPKDVLIINQRIEDAVAAFVSKAVPAVALWLPHDLLVKRRDPTAKMLLDASAYYPETAVVNGWVARNGFHNEKKDLLASIVRAWARANDFLVGKPDEALAMLRDRYYPKTDPNDFKQQFDAEKVYSSRDWRHMYTEGSVTELLQQVTNFYVTFAAVQRPVPAIQYFDTSIYLSATIHD